MTKSRTTVKARRCVEPHKGMGGKAKRLCALAAGRGRSVFRVYDDCDGFRGWQVRDALGTTVIGGNCANLTELEAAIISRNSK